MSLHPPPLVSARSDLVIRLIALMKLVKAALLIAIGLGALSLRHQDAWLATWLQAITADPHGRYVSELLAKLGTLDAHTMMHIGVGSLLYASVFVVEGVGLMMREAWAEVMTVAVTISFIPIELYEMVAHRSLAKAVVIVINVAMATYLLFRLRREQHWPFHRRRAP